MLFRSKRPVKKVRREGKDPWKLGSSAVGRDWTQMKAPPLEMFYFARTVVDEYTYLEGKVHSMVTHLSAERRWVLSGTPPLSDFGAIKTISAFLGVHLGIDDDGEGESAKKRKREQTGEHTNHYTIVHILSMQLQMSRSSTPSARCIALSGTLIVTNLARRSSIATSVR